MLIGSGNSLLKTTKRTTAGVGCPLGAEIPEPRNSLHFPMLTSRVADPDLDPNWIRIQSGQWIRIRIRNPDRIQEGKNDLQK
jgi:hypothetical protein